jgi:transposase
VTIAREVEAEIARLFHAEHWKVGTIAAQLGVHEDVVRRVIRGNPRAPRARAPSPSAVAPFVGFIRETLDRYPKLCSSRLEDMLRQRGFEGSARTLRRYIQGVRPKGEPQVFARLNALIGEEAQVDWAYVSQVPVPGGHRSLWLFLIVLSWSRAAWGEFCFDTTVHSLLRSLVRAASYFGGTTRRWLFDNAKVVVLERHGQASRYHPLLVELARVMRVELRLCNPYRGNEKGRVERKIRFLRQRFLEGRELYGIEQGNRELLEFFDQIGHQQRHPNFKTRTIAECLAEERSRLLPLPYPLPATDQVTPAAVDKTAFVRFDTNLYSVPARYAQETLALAADDRTVRLLDGQVVIAEHRRSWGHGETIEAPDHRAEIARRKRGAALSSGRDRIRAAAPGIEVLLERWVEAGRHVGSMVAQTGKLLDLYGLDVFRKAVAETVARGTHDPGEIGVLCEKYRRQAEAPLPMDLRLGDHVPDRDVIPHDLGGYDVER